MTDRFDGSSIFAEGVLEVLPDSYGLLRSSDYSYAPGPDDIYVPGSLIRTANLRTGDTVSGQVLPPLRSGKRFEMVRVEAVNFKSALGTGARIDFDQSPKRSPTERLHLETTRENLCPRVIDLMAPLGKGQLALITGPAGIGQRLLLETIARSIGINHPDITVVVLLLNENALEAEATRHSLVGEVAFSAEDEPPVRHVQLAELVVEKAKRQVENRRDVVLILNSVTCLAGSYYAALCSRTLPTKEIADKALLRTKCLLRAAAKVAQGGSLTILATVDDEAGPLAASTLSALTEIADAEISLSRQVARHGIFPAIDILRSRNKSENTLVPEDDLLRVQVLRQVLQSLSAAEAAVLLGSKMTITQCNSDLLLNMSAF